MQTYKTIENATKALDALMGWPDARVEQMHQPGSDDADADGYVYVICCDPQSGRYMQADGYVR